jgi:sec-independent protein translocase protein TatB
VFGFSFSEVVLIGVVTLIAVGPQRLPGMLKNLAQWIRKLRKMTIEVRQQTGIDEMLRAEGLHGGLNELRGLMRGGGGLGSLATATAPAPYRAPEDPYRHIDIDVAREYPPEGPDVKDALPDDLLANDDSEPAADADAPVAVSADALVAVSADAPVAVPAATVTTAPAPEPKPSGEPKPSDEPKREPATRPAS